MFHALVLAGSPKTLRGDKIAYHQVRDRRRGEQDRIWPDFTEGGELNSGIFLLSCDTLPFQGWSRDLQSCLPSLSTSACSTIRGFNSRRRMQIDYILWILRVRSVQKVDRLVYERITNLQAPEPETLSSIYLMLLFFSWLVLNISNIRSRVLPPPRSRFSSILYSLKLKRGKILSHRVCSST